MNMSQRRLTKIGEVATNKYGNSMEIIKYNLKSRKNITVKFENGFITNTRYEHFLKGCVKSPYDKSIQGAGYLGEGIYKPCIENVPTKQYVTWRGMIRRCYDSKMHLKYPTYIDCTVCEEWLNFQNFAKWYDKNYYQISDKIMCLDKDILHKNNKIYSPESCMLVSQRINSLFCKCNATRGKYPIGVSFDKLKNKFKSECRNIDDSRINLGFYDNINKAFNVYKDYKEKVIKGVADKYRVFIPQKLYDAMYRYKVEITD